MHYYSGMYNYIVRIYKDRRGEYRWRLQALNGRIVADSAEGYSRKSRCHQMAEKIFPYAEIK